MIRFFIQVVIVFVCVVLSIKWTVEAILFREVYLFVHSFTKLNLANVYATYAEPKQPLACFGLFGFGYRTMNHRSPRPKGAK